MSQPSSQPSRLFDNSGVTMVTNGTTVFVRFPHKPPDTVRADIMRLRYSCSRDQSGYFWYTLDTPSIRTSTLSVLQEYVQNGAQPDRTTRTYRAPRTRTYRRSDRRPPAYPSPEPAQSPAPAPTAPAPAPESEFGICAGGWIENVQNILVDATRQLSLVVEHAGHIAECRKVCNALSNLLCKAGADISRIR